MSEKLEWRVKTPEKGKLIAFLVSKFPSVSQRQLRRALDGRCCEVNGKVERFANTMLKPGDLVVFHGDLGQYEKRQKVLFDTKAILYEDEHLLAFNKPPGVSCDQTGVLDLLKDHCPNLHLVHRLDKQTSGVFVMAKDKATKDSLEALFRTRNVLKVYLAVVDGIPKEKKGKIENFVDKLRSFGHGQQLWGVVEEGGKIAITEWKIKEDWEDSSLLVCVPLTGRTHQIRVHLAHMGFPILGDFQYATNFKSQRRPERHLLHAWKITLPIDGEDKTIVAPIPEDMQG